MDPHPRDEAPPWWTARVPQTYAQWLKAEGSALTAYDRKELDAERQWVANNPETARVLDAMVGKRMQLTRDRQNLDETETYLKGTLFHITGFWGGFLHGFSKEKTHTVFRLLPEWLQKEPDAKPALRLRKRYTRLRA